MKPISLRLTILTLYYFGLVLTTFNIVKAQTSTEDDVGKCSVLRQFFGFVWIEFNRFLFKKMM